MWQHRSGSYRLTLESIATIARLGRSYLLRDKMAAPIEVYVGGSHSPLSHHAPHVRSDLDLFFVLDRTLATFDVSAPLSAFLDRACRRTIQAHIVDTETATLLPDIDWVLVLAKDATPV